MSPRPMIWEGVGRQAGLGKAVERKPVSLESRLVPGRDGLWMGQT